MTTGDIMRIGYLVPEFPSQTHAFFWREAMALEEQGFDIRFITTRRPRVETSHHAFTQAAQARTASLTPPSPMALTLLAAHPVRLARAITYLANLHESPAGARIAALRLLPAAATLAHLARAEGLAHVHVHSFGNAAHVAALARILGGPSWSATLHGDLLVYGRDHAAKLRNAAFATAVTRPLAAALAKEVPGLVAPVITMGADTRLFTPGDSVPAPPLHIITIARLQHMKGHAYLLRAMSMLRNEGVELRATFVGEGPERAAIMAEISRLGLSNHVRLTGALGQEDVLQELRGAHVLALTSFGQGEAAPVSVMEAMSCGLPVVVSRIGGTEDMIDDGQDGLLVSQQSEAEIAAALRRLAKDSALRHRLGQAARVKAVATFDHRHKAAALGQLIRASAGN